MKKILAILVMVLPVAAAMANEYGEDTQYDAITAIECPLCECATTSGTDISNYAGVRIYKNEHSAYSYNLSNGHKEKYKKDNFGFGTTVGNTLTDYLRVGYLGQYAKCLSVI